MYFCFEWAIKINYLFTLIPANPAKSDIIVFVSIESILASPFI
jgi:hypothetical protein